jgi:hypothetical protein
MARRSRDSASRSAAPSRTGKPRGPARDAGSPGRAGVVPSLDDLLGHTRQQLIARARSAGLKGIERLTKPQLAARIREEIERQAAAMSPPEPADAPHKFDLGLAHEVAEEPADIPWGYGEDRVTAMAIDPERLYVYWEVTDGALARARAGLGPGGRDAWFTLRVYDVTGRIFDGTNAHHYFDHAVSRTDRQWFFSIGRPASTVVVEIGLKSDEGYFVRIARSGRADFPRLEPTSAGPVEWLTVRSASGEVGEPTPDLREAPAVVAGHAWPTHQPEAVRVWDIRRSRDGWAGERVQRDERFVTVREEWGEWVREGAIQWEGPTTATAWEAGPFSYPVEPPRRVEERWEEPASVRSVNGTTHIVHGAWRVVIRGLGARAERKVLAVWEIHRSWGAHGGSAARATGGTTRAPGAAGSEQVILGASERLWRAASEMRLGGASEVYLMGASELRLRGASELFYAGASEWRARGASERVQLGASEWRERGASEERYLGASEWRAPGASEIHQAGASERLYPGASERAGEHRAPYPAGPSPRG